MAIQHHVNAANAATAIMSKLCKDVRASELPASTRHAMCEDIFDLSELVDELEHLADIAVKSKARVWFLRTR